MYKAPQVLILGTGNVIGLLLSATQAFHPSRLKIRYLQQKQKN